MKLGCLEKITLRPLSVIPAKVVIHKNQILHFPIKSGNDKKMNN
jgi:hypothetical protein